VVKRITVGLISLVLVAIIISNFVLPLPILKAAGSQGLIESSRGQFSTLNDAINNSYDGDTLHVYGGQYFGPISVDKSLTIIGHNWPVIDGENNGTVISLKASNIALKGFVIKNSGDVLDEENSGIAVESTGVIIESNRFEDTLFGIYLRQASNSIIRNNIIGSKDLPPPRRGDPIRIWFSHDVLVENNRVENGRDVVLWYSERLTVRGNDISGGRYGLHFMYCDEGIVEMNRLTNNSLGAFMMYSRNLQFNNNIISDNRGPTGYGLGLKDVDDGIIRDNVFAGNRVGVALDNSPRKIDSSMKFEENVFEFNDIGVRFTPSVRRNEFSGNSFKDNQQQVSISGSGTLLDNYWTIDGVGNYWSDYAGFDANQDGVGDIPYKSEQLFENLIDKYPKLRLFIYSPAILSIDFSARALPMIKPQPKLVDDAPLMDTRFPVSLPILPKATSRNIGIMSGGLMGILLILLLLSRLSIREKIINQKTEKLDDSSVIQIEKLTKRYKSTIVVDDLTLTIAGGESVALWGSNGAGKTTIIRCLLGLLEYEGSIKVNELDLKDNGKAVRRMIGYVPQELNLHEDLTVIDTMIFYSDLKKSAKDSIEILMGQMGLVDHSQKQVKQLSGGIKQRLALALALLSDPPILILDEPTASLDAQSRKSFLSQILKLKEAGKTLIFASHRTTDILSIADRVIVLENGQTINQPSPSEVQSTFGNELTLHIQCLDYQLKDASDLLQDQGFDVHRNSSGISLKVAAEDKTRPIGILMKAGITVTDFDSE